MKQNAIENGKEYIAKEKELNLLFELGHITPASADSLLMEIGEIKAKLRAVHVQAHIKMKEILTSEQISKYDQLRGYTNGSPDHVHL